MIHIGEVRVSPFVEEHIWMKHHVTHEEAEEVCFSDPRAPGAESQLRRLRTNRSRTASDGLHLPGGRRGFSYGNGPRHGAGRTAPLPAE